MTGADATQTQMSLAMYGGSPLRYRDNGRAVASVVFLWVGTVFTYARSVPTLLPRLLNRHSDLNSTYLLFRSLAHIDLYGPKSMHARVRDDIAKPDGEKPRDSGSLAESNLDGTSLTQPGAAAARPEGFHDRNADANQHQHSAV